MTNPILPPTALLRPMLPGVYQRAWIYDPTWTDPSYNAYVGQRIVPAVGSIVQDADQTPLWVIEIDPVTYYPTYSAIPLSTENDNVTSMLNYGNATLRLYVDYRHAPYPATPDSKCIFIGKSPRFYTLSRYPNTSQETIISQYYDGTGQLVGQMVPLVAMDSTNTSWYLQRGNINQILTDGEEIRVKIFNEDGVEVYSAIMFAKTSSVINSNVVYNPTIVGMTVNSLQKLNDGTNYLFETQDFNSLGLTVSLVYDDGSVTNNIPIDGQKVIMYGQQDFIASFAGLRQHLIIKYFRSENEAINPGIADATGQMISVDVPVTVIPNTLGTTAKIVPIPWWNATLARYITQYHMYWGDGRSSTDVSGYVTLANSTLDGTSASFGIAQTIVMSVDMSQVDPVNYPTQTTYTQTAVITFNPSVQLVRYTIRDSSTSQYVYGIDNSNQRRPSVRVDRTLNQAFIPSWIFGNTQAFLNSGYYAANPPYDPSVSQVPQAPTHFVIRDSISNAMLVSSPIPVASYAQAVNFVGANATDYIGATVVVEFINRISTTVSRTLFGAPVDVTSGTYIAPQ